MTDRAEILRNSRDSYSVILNNLIKGYSKFPKALFCIYEGEDAKYYSIRVENLSGYRDQNIKSLPCRGKKEVLKVYDTVLKKKDLSKCNVVFFIDRDFDGLCGYQKSDKLYITPCYSIENLYVRPSVLKKVLIQEFNVDELNEEDELDKLLTLFNKMLDRVLDIMTLLNAWIALQIEKANQGSKLNLNNHSLDKFMKIELDLIESKYDKQKLEIIFTECISLTEEELNRKQEEFKSKDTKDKIDIFRGKYLIEFLRIFLEKLKKDRESKTPKCFNQRSTVKLVLTTKNIISELSQYAETPPCLESFLSQLRDL